MKIIYMHDKMLPELMLTGSCLAENGFTANVSVKIQREEQGLKITLVTEEKAWCDLCHYADASVAPDVIHEDGSLYLAGEWLAALGITADARFDMEIVEKMIVIKVLEQRH
ncbi:hypothetical protein SOASR030_35450 [Leminorella grimontii]|uniref:Type I toxin-antitoxin system SymE family toxin n=1 Tax=Leminorella grimontii TaxID=82981 RepID=A0AAV5N5N4_9GAMM|nr:hypothetical protein [Leminorella grimontii]KFC94402.1 SymE family toxin [Leminorella grimontii ATCC 33999 = DSM 5078]GKX57433.1 hypothetical protein SOASR030_35450 [Leminorella grimontii]VFS54618.1 HSP20-like domain of uncharacterised function (DUF1813) [Leminorella grimontii]